MEAIINELIKIITNYKKAGSRGYLVSTIKLKLDEIELLKREFSDLLERNLIDTGKIEESRNTFEKYYDAARKLLEEALERKVMATNDQSNNVQLNNPTNMTNQQFSLETALKVIPEFAGNYKELNSFLTIVELVNNGLAVDQREVLIKFVYNVKLATTVRTALGTSAPTSFSTLKTILTSRYKNTKTVAQLQATLSKLSQKNMNIHAYHELLLDLIAELSELQIREIENCNVTQSDTIRLINENYALNVFKNGLNGELKPTVTKANRPS